MKKGILLLLLCSCFGLLSAQKSELGFQLGLSHYLGDLVPSSISFKNGNVAFGPFYRHHINEKWAIKGNLLFSKLKGNDADYDDRASRGYSFESSLTEISILGEWNVLGQTRWNEDGTFKKNSSPYLFIGIGGAIGTPTTKGLPEGSPDLVADYGSFNLVIPVGLGYKIDLNERMNLGLQYSFRISMTDYLDGISESAGADKNDWYSILSLNFGYFLGKQNNNQKVMDSKQ